MDEEPELDDYEPVPPTADKVAARALALAAVSFRGLIEQDAGKRGMKKILKDMNLWLDEVGVSSELEAKESALLDVPVGKLARQQMVNACWRSEGMVVLAWALQRAELPSHDAVCEPNNVGYAMGMLDPREQTVLANPDLRDLEEIERRASTCLALHWRLRNHQYNPGPINLPDFAENCGWAEMNIDGLEIIDGDLAIQGVPIGEVDDDTFHEVLSITQERHHAFNWLLGDEPLYSDITTDT